MPPKRRSKSEEENKDTDNAQSAVKKAKIDEPANPPAEKKEEKKKDSDTEDEGDKKVNSRWRLS